MLLLVLLMLTPLVHTEKPTVVCFGDSITLGIGLKDAAYPTVLSKLLETDVVNAGVGGNTTAAGLARIDKDVLAAKSAVVVAMFGTNDSVISKPGVYRVPVDKFEANLREIVTRCRSIGAKVVLCTPCPIVAERYYTRHPKEYYDPVGGLPAVLNRYCEAVKKVGSEMSVPVVDIQHAFGDDLRPFEKDGVHPDASGAKIIAEGVSEAVKPLLK
jgi:lysophospholipase L1-like esterase